MKVMNAGHEEDDEFLEEFEDKVRSCKVCLRLEPALNYSGAKIVFIMVLCWNDALHCYVQVGIL